MAKKRPTQRSLERLRSEGHECDVVERWVRIPKHPGGGIRKDLFGGIDLVTIANNKTTGFQCGAMTGHSGHKKKLLAEPRMLLWLNAGNRLVIHSWGLQGPKGKAKRWTLREEELTLKDFETTPELDLFV